MNEQLAIQLQKHFSNELQALLRSVEQACEPNKLEPLLENPQARIATKHNIATPLQLCVAYSGGLDSTVLLHAAHHFCLTHPQISLSAFHVNHGINAGANDWQQHCLQQCELLNIPFYTTNLKLTKTPQQSLEADARNARYQALCEFAGNQKTVLLGQHQDDQAETFLLQLKRGAGVQGLAAMGRLFVRVLPHSVKNHKALAVRYLRPFLALPRASLHAYARQYQLSWVEDESNQDLVYERNFVRAKILPILQQRWPQFSDMLARSASHCADAANVNDEYMALLSKSLLQTSNQQMFAANDWFRLDIIKFKGCSDSVQRTFLRYWLSTSCDLTLSVKQLNELISLIDKAWDKNLDEVPSTNGKSPYVQYANIAIEQYGQFVQLIERTRSHQVTQKPKPIALDFTAQSTIQLNENFTLSLINDTSIASAHISANSTDFSLPKEGVLCEFGASNVKFKQQQNRPLKKLKSWYQEWGISPLQRQQIPVFSKNAHALVIGLKQPKLSAYNIDDGMWVRLNYIST